MKNLAVLLLVVAVLPVNKLRAQSCLPADAQSGLVIATVKRLVTGTSQGTAQSRTMLHLPNLLASQVTIVTNDTLCVRARQAEDSVVHATNSSAPAELPVRGLYVIKLGDYNAVVDPGAKSEGHIMIGFFDPAWKYLGSIPTYPVP